MSEQASCPLEADEYLSLLAAITKNLTHEIESVPELIERLAETQTPEISRTISVYLAILRKRSEIDCALSSVRLLNLLGCDQQFASSLRNYQMVVAALDEALRDFEQQFLGINGSDESAPTNISERLARIEAGLIRNSEVATDVTEMLKRDLLRFERKDYERKRAMLSIKEEDFYQACCENHPIRAAALCEKAGYKFDSGAKTTLSVLSKKLGLLEVSAGGYRPAPIPGEESHGSV